MSLANDAGPEPGDWATESAGRELRPHRVVEGEARWTKGFERDEQVARVVRLRKMVLWGGVAWLAFLPTDLSFNALRQETYGPSFVLARLLALVPLALLWLRLSRSPTPGRRFLAIGEALAISVIAGVTAWMAVLSGGLTSPILVALTPILVVRAIAIPEPWTRGLPITLVPAAVFWFVIAVGTALAPSAPPLDRVTAATLILHLGVLVATVGIITLGNHIAWDVRRNLYKARNVGRYELCRPLGRGAMGEVWAAWHQGIRQEVALKILPVDGDPAAVARFEREVAATTKLRHPNTVRVYDFGFTPDGFWYYAMELLEGETLAELVAGAGPLAIPRALGLLRQAARALSEAHCYGIVHRDIKPENLFVSAPAGERDIIKVLDFGVASIAAEAAPDSGATEPLMVRELSDDEGVETEPGFEPGSRSVGAPPKPELRERAVGTPLYVSPEVATGGAADPRSDIYGLGCVLYFMLTGRPVFIERDVEQLLRAHAEKPPPSPSTLLAEALPEYVEKLVMRCLAKDPEQRYADADTLVRAIDLCLRLGEIDRRRGATEAQQPRVRAGRQQIEVWTKLSKTETDMTLIGSGD
jgi:serine/threonine protein kinase